jgi:hypothetical protein
MVTASFHKEEFSLRFAHLSSNTASRLRNRIQNVEIQSRQPEVISLLLHENANLKSLYEFPESETLDANTYSVWVSVLSSTDHDGVRLPKYILDTSGERVAVLMSRGLVGL